MAETDVIRVRSIYGKSTAKISPRINMHILAVDISQTLRRHFWRGYVCSAGTSQSCHADMTAAKSAAMSVHPINISVYFNATCHTWRHCRCRITGVRVIFSGSHLVKRRIAVVRRNPIRTRAVSFRWDFFSRL